jgi:hypothetical protein
MLKEVLQCMPNAHVLYFDPFNPFHFSPLCFTSHLPFFNSFQHTSLYPLPSHLMLCNITDALSFSFPFPLSQSSIGSSNITNVFYIWVCIWLYMYMFIFGSIFHRWEKTCDFCVSYPGLLHLTWCPPIASIYLQTTCHYSLWLSNIPLCIYTKFSWSIHQF